jgi:thioredoxin-dependent peroxiredoxin
MCSTPFIRMAYSSGGRVLYLVAQLRRMGTTVAAIAIGVFNMATHASETPVDLKPGDPAPDFSLPGSDGRTYRLKEFAGRPLVIAWFPKAFTGGCTAECKSLSAFGDELGRMGVTHFAASVDAVGANTRFAESLALSYPILSDATKEVARAYGVLAPSGYASRWTFFIGADGRILDIDKKVSAVSHGRDIVAKLTEHQVQGSTTHGSGLDPVRER